MKARRFHLETIVSPPDLLFRAFFDDCACGVYLQRNSSALLIVH
jgi:hypothetical protein